MNLLLSEQELARGLTLTNGGAPVSRRKFLQVLSGSAAGLAMGGSAMALAACGSDDGTGVTTPPTTGRITGTIVDDKGVPQASLGQMILLTASGARTGRTVNVNAVGKFA